MKKIAVMPVKNEDWILEYTLECASLFFDHIIVADQNSTDRTPDICKKFPKVVYIKNELKEYDEGKRRQLLLDAARQFPGNNFIANIAADEVFTANILNPERFEKLVQDKKPGTAFSFQWVQLWKTADVYRDDNSVWSNFYRPFAFIDDRVTNYKPGFAHLSIVPEDLVNDAITIDDIKVLHYQFVDFERMLMKQRWARLLEFGSYTQPTFLKSVILNNKYYITKDEHNMRLAPVATDWIKPYPVFIKQTPKESWHVNTSIEFIQKYGAENLRWLDIWDFNWPNTPDTRSFIQRWYHGHQHLILVANKIIPKQIKKLIKSI